MVAEADDKAWPRPLADWVDTCINPALARRGFAEADIITQWEDIAGTWVASGSFPLNLEWPWRAPQTPPDVPRQPATLVLRVDSFFALELQHMQEQLIDRLNRHIGWRCICKIRMLQGPLPPPPPPKRRLPPPDPRAVERARQATEGIEEPALRDALMRLGSRVLDDKRLR